MINFYWMKSEDDKEVLVVKFFFEATKRMPCGKITGTVKRQMSSK